MTDILIKLPPALGMNAIIGLGANSIKEASLVKDIKTGLYHLHILSKYPDHSVFPPDHLKYFTEEEGLVALKAVNEGIKLSQQIYKENMNEINKILETKNGTKLTDR